MSNWAEIYWIQMIVDIVTESVRFEKSKLCLLFTDIVLFFYYSFNK